MTKLDTSKKIPSQWYLSIIYHFQIVYIFIYYLTKQLFLCLIKTHYCSSIQRVNSKLSNILLHVIERSHSWYHFSTKMHRFKTRTKWYIRNVGASLSSAKRHHFSPLHRIFLFAQCRSEPCIIYRSASERISNKIARLPVRKVKIHYIY